MTVDFTTRATPREERRRLGVGDIWKNAAKCANCGDEIQSNNRHDYVTCSCGEISVDGGSWYARGSGDPDDFIWCGGMYDDVQPVD